MSTDTGIEESFESVILENTVPILFRSLIRVLLLSGWTVLGVRDSVTPDNAVDAVDIQYSEPREQMVVQ